MRGSDLVVVVEAAKYKSLVRQADLAACGSSLGNHLCRSRSPGRYQEDRRLFPKSRSAGPRRNHKAIGEDVVDVLRTDRAWISEVVHLNGRGTQCEYPGTGIESKALSIHGDIDFKIPNETRNLEIAFLPNIDEPVERPLESRFASCFWNQDQTKQQSFQNACDHAVRIAQPSRKPSGDHENPPTDKRCVSYRDGIAHPARRAVKTQGICVEYNLWEHINWSRGESDTVKQRKRVIGALTGSNALYNLRAVLLKRSPVAADASSNDASSLTHIRDRV